MVSSNVLDSFPCLTTIYIPANIHADDNKEQNYCETRDDAEDLCNAFLKLAEAFRATGAKAFYGTLVQGK